MQSRDVRRFEFGPWRRWGTVLCLLLLVVPAVAFAQTTGTVEGAVTDQSDAPLPGVTVELDEPEPAGRAHRRRRGGRPVRFPSVPPGRLHGHGDAAGFGKVQKNATVTLDSTATVDLQLNLSTTAEVTVTGEAPLVDVDVDDDGQQLLGEGHRQAAGRPQLRGRSCSRSRASRRTSARRRAAVPSRAMGGISIYGSTSSENLFLIDGVNTTNVIKGFQGKDINSEFIQEVEVKTGGYQAEYGRNTGGVINVITKSGGNEFHGGVFGYYNDTGMRADQKNGERPELATPADSADAQADQRSSTKDVRQEWRRWTSAASLEGQDLVLRRVRPRHRSTRTSSRSTGPVTGEQLPVELRPEQVLGQADVQPAPGHVDRRAASSPTRQTQRRRHSTIPPGANPVRVQRPPRHRAGRTTARG